MTNKPFTMITANYEKTALIYAMTTPTNQCKCGKPASQLVIIKTYSIFLCAKHTKELEQFLGEKIEPLTTQYYEARI
jgi:hypothetical protein